MRFEACDLRDIPALRAAVARVRDALGPITGLVNNAAHDERHATLEVTPDYFDERIATNFRHQFFASQAVLPDMQAAGGGAIVCMSSIVPMIGMGGMPAYAASKSAVIGLARSLARDFGPDNVRVNVIAPGWIMTERQMTLWLTPEADAMREDRQALKRRLVPDDVARVALFLISEEFLRDHRPDPRRRRRLALRRVVAALTSRDGRKPLGTQFPDVKRSCNADAIHMHVRHRRRGHARAVPNSRPPSVTSTIASPIARTPRSPGAAASRRRRSSARPPAPARPRARW